MYKIDGHNSRVNYFWSTAAYLYMNRQKRHILIAKFPEGDACQFYGLVLFFFFDVRYIAGAKFKRG
jgi:hypothetical protein